MLLVVVQLADSIADGSGSFDPSGDDFVADFFTQQLLAEVWHDR
jgi:hypothetical protein